MYSRSITCPIYHVLLTMKFPHSWSERCRLNIADYYLNTDGWYCTECFCQRFRGAGARSGRRFRPPFHSPSKPPQHVWALALIKTCIYLPALRYFVFLRYFVYCPTLRLHLKSPIQKKTNKESLIAKERCTLFRRNGAIYNSRHVCVLILDAWSSAF